MSGIFVREGTQYVSASDKPAYAIRIDGATTVSSASASIYKNGTLVTSTNMVGATGDTIVCTISGTIINIPVCQSLVGGNTYVISCVFTADGVQGVRKIKMVVQKDGDE